jgi:hypothetical protein
VLGVRGTPVPYIGHTVLKGYPLNAKLNPICHLLTLLGAHHIVQVSRIGVKGKREQKEGHNDARPGLFVKKGPDKVFPAINIIQICMITVTALPINLSTI